MIKTDLAGVKFGKLTALKSVGKNKSGNTLWLCKCDCGGEAIAVNSNLTRGNSKSCGCVSRSKVVERNTKYKHSDSPIYGIWRGILSRCHTKSSTIYQYYGGRGIQICEEWRDYEAFYNWAINSQYQKGLTLERIDYDGDYKPSNCRWATKLEQANNKSTTFYVMFRGIKESLADTCRRYNANYKNTWKRLKKGWSLEMALFS